MAKRTPEQRKEENQRYRDRHRDKINAHLRERYHRRQKYLRRQKTGAMPIEMFRQAIKPPPLQRKFKRRIYDAVFHMIRTRRNAAHSRIIGCSAMEFRTHIEAQFTGDMSWDNYGTLWEMDHIKPCAHFDLSNPDQFQACAHFSNCRPILRPDNSKRSTGVIQERIQKFKWEMSQKIFEANQIPVQTA